MKVVVGMSGGVDSSVAAALLKQQGYEVIGVTMALLPDLSEEEVLREGGCCSLSDVSDARRICDALEIPHYTLNFKDLFEEKVIQYFEREYLVGRTPNPCIACNRHLKFDALLKKARALGADYIATGHYARICFENDRYYLKKSLAKNKDQTYVLYNLTQEQLAHILMPLSDIEKDETRNIAKKLGLRTANKPESMEICFVPDNDYAGFLKKRGIEEKPGNFVDANGGILGKHKGIFHYTIGQRKGLGGTFGKPMYVIDIDALTNTVVLGEDEQNNKKSLVCRDLNFISCDFPKKPMEVSVKIRYTAMESDALITPMGEDEVLVEFKTPQRAVTPGQAAVFYDGDMVVGGGVIDRCV